MLRVLVVDDEPFILDGIAELLRDEERWDVLTASGGKQALDVLDRCRTDIVLSDIQMSGIDGIRLLDEIQMRWPFCKTVFLTAHDKFELARTALSKGAFGYLLKSDGDKAILAELRRCEQQIDIEMETMLDFEQSRQKARKAANLLENAALLNILEWMPYDIAKQELKALGIALDLDAPMLLVAAGIDNFSPQSNSHERFLIMVRVEEIFHKYISQKFYCRRASDADKNMVWILQPKESVQNGLLYCKQSLEGVQRAVFKLLGLSLSIVYDEYIGFDQLHDRYRQMLSILAQIFIQGEGQVLADSKFYIDRHGSQPGDSSGSFLRDLEMVRQALAVSSTKDFADALRRVLYSRENGTAMKKLQTYHVVCGIVLEYIESAGMGEEVFSRPEHFAIFRNYGGRTALLQKLSGLAQELFKKRQAMHTSRSDALIQSIHNHITANLAGDLSLQTIADAFYVNPAYLARLYKKQTGGTLGEEIVYRRIALAKRMLLRSEYKIAEIAKDAGYESAAYFTRVFKKREGVTPQAWRAARLVPTGEVVTIVQGK